LTRLTSITARVHYMDRHEWIANSPVEYHDRYGAYTEYYCLNCGEKVKVRAGRFPSMAECKSRKQVSK